MRLVQNELEQKGANRLVEASLLKNNQSFSFITCSTPFSINSCRIMSTPTKKKKKKKIDNSNNFVTSIIDDNR